MSKQIKKTEIAEEGVLDNLLKPLKELLDVINKADTKLKGFADDIDGSFTFKEDSKGLRELEVNLKKTNKLAEQKKKVQQDQTKIEKQLADAKGRLNKLSVQEERLLKARLQTDQQSIKVQDQKTKQLITEERLKQAQLRTDKQIQAEKEKEARQNAKLAKQKADENNAYKQLSKASRDYKNESKRLGAELLKLEQAGDKNTKEFKDLSNQYKTVTAQARTTDAQLKKLDTTVGDNFRNVGNYKSALNGASRALGQLGIALGVGGVATGILNYNRELSKATNIARTFFEVNEQGAKDIAQEATTLSKVYGKDVNEVLRSANVISKQFGTDGAQSLALLNQGFEKGADVSGEFLENISEYSTQLRLAGLDAEQSISIITQSQQAGVFSDKGIDAIKEATLSLREMTDPAKEALDAIGMSAEQVQRDIANGTKSYFDVIQEISTRTNKIGEESQEAGMILADVFKGAGEDAGDFIFKLGELDTDLNKLENQNQGLEGAVQNLTRSWYDFIGGLNESINSSGALSTTINFLADNLGTIVSMIGKLIVGFLTYKAILIAVNVQQKIASTGVRGLAKQFFTLKKGATEAGTASKGMGSALKGIGWSALIGVAIELAVAFYDMASGADEARRKAQQLDDYRANAEQQATANVNHYNKAYEQRLFNLREEERILISQAKNEAEIDKIRSKFLEKRQKEAEKQVKLFKNFNRQVAFEIIQNEELIDVLDKVDRANGQILNGSEELAEQLRKAGIENAEYNETWATMNVTVDELVQTQNRLEAETEGLKVEQESYNLAIEKSANILKTINGDIKVNSNERENNINKINAQVKSLGDQNKELEKQKEAIDLISDSFGNKETLDIDTSISKQNEAIKKAMTERLTMINDLERNQTLTEKEAQDQRLIAEIEALNKRKKILELYGRDVTDINNEISQAQLQLSKGVNADIEELLKGTNKNLVDSTQETVKQVGNTIADTYSNIFQRQIDELKKQEDTAKQVYGTLEKLASEGNIAAQQSLAEQIQAQQEAQREQIRLQQKQANIEKARQVYAIIQSQLDEGKSASEAIASTGGFMTAIQGLIQSLPSFYEGTEDTGKAGKALDNKGGRLAVLHNNERVLTADQNKHLQGIPNPMIPVLVNKALDSAGNSYDLLAIDELRRTRQAIEKLPQSTYQLESAMGQIVKMVATHKTGNSTTKNTYK